MKFNLNTNFNIQTDISHENVDYYSTLALSILNEYNDKHMEQLSRLQDRCFESLVYYCKLFKCELCNIKIIKTNNVLYFNTILFLSKNYGLKLNKLTLMSDAYGFPPNVNYDFSCRCITQDYTVIDGTGNFPFMDELEYICEDRYIIEIK